METIRRIMAAMEAMDEWAGGHTRIVNDPHRPLLIEWLGEAKGEGDFVSVSHTYDQNGILRRDPEIVFHVTEDDWTPVTFRNDSTGEYRAAMVIDDGEIRYVRPRLVQQLREFARIWDNALASQGYLQVITGT